MAFSTIQPSFAAGELSPSLYARVDLAKYHVGAALLRNFFVDYRGGASTRPGTQFICECKADAVGTPRLIPFTVSTEATYVIETGDEYMRFVSDGAQIESAPGVPYTLTTPYVIADVPLVKYTQSADVLSLTQSNYPPYNLTRTSPTTFSLDEIVVGASIEPPSNLVGTPLNPNSVRIIYSYVVTAVSQDGKEESLPCYRVDVEQDVNGEGGDEHPAIMLTWDASPSNNVGFYRIYKAAISKGRTENGGGSTVNTLFGFLDQSLTTTYTDVDASTSAPDFSKTPPQPQDPFSPGQIATVDLNSSGTTGYSAVYTTPLIFTGDGTGAAGYAVIDPQNNTVAGVVITNYGRDYTTCTCADGIGDAVYNVNLGSSSGTYPKTVTYFQQRRAFGGTPNFPESLNFSQPGGYKNFNTSAISSDSDAITISIASRLDNSIVSMVPMNTGLVTFTSGAGFLVSGGGANSTHTPTSITAFPHAASGANDLIPQVVNYDILYGQARGFVIRDLAFNFYVQSYTGTDRSVLASHLFLTYSPVDWAYAEEPFRLIHLVRDDGALLQFTYVPEQEIFAWSKADTNGKFISVASVPEGQENAVYTIVQRFVDGAYRYYIERFASRQFHRQEDAWFVDCGLSLPQTYPAASLTLNRAVLGAASAISSVDVFAPGDVGKVIWGLREGKATVTDYVGPAHILISIEQPFPVFLNDAANTPMLLDAGTWTLDTPVDVVTGLDHLEGKSITGLVDGTPLAAPLVVEGGSVTLPVEGTKVILGLGYQCQLKTLKIDLGDPTVQGKRKNIPAVTLRVDKTRGLKVGPDFNSLISIKDLEFPYTPAAPLVSDDLRVIIPAVWKVDGQIAIQQDWPLPATVLGVIPEVVVGDTQR